jgi:phage shock protein A
MLKKLWTIITGLFRKTGEAVIDKNILTLIDQQIHNAKESIKTSKEGLAVIMGKNKVEKEKESELKTKLAENITYIEKLVAKTGDAPAQAAAQKVAAEIAKIETELAGSERTIAQYDATITKIKADIARSEDAIKDLARRRDLTAANGALIKAQSQTASLSAARDSEVNQALESLARTEAMQQETLARFDAAEEYAKETDGSSLDRELEALNVKKGAPSAESVLARYQTKATQE